MSKVLIIEDVAELSDLVKMYLVKEQMEVAQAESAEIAFSLLENFLPDLVILDLNLPGMDGFEFLKIFREKYNAPVIIVSARDADNDIIKGFGIGADEFVTKPFSPKVLAARVKAVLRRSAKSQESSQVFKFGPYVLALESYTLLKNSERIMLSAKEFAVLKYFVKNPGKPLPPETIYKQIWGDIYGDLSAVAVYVQRLRKKIEADPSNPKFIQTIFGLGYQFNGIEQ